MEAAFSPLPSQGEERGRSVRKGPPRILPDDPEERVTADEERAVQKASAAWVSALPTLPALSPLLRSEEGPDVPISESEEDGSLSPGGSISDLLLDPFRTGAFAALAEPASPDRSAERLALPNQHERAPIAPTVGSKGASRDEIKTRGKKRECMEIGRSLSPPGILLWRFHHTGA